MHRTEDTRKSMPWKRATKENDSGDHVPYGDMVANCQGIQTIPILRSRLIQSFRMKTLRNCMSAEALL